MRTVEWIDYGRFPRSELVVVAGLGGLGKSAYCCQLARQISRGETNSSAAGSARSVVFCSAEDSWEHTLKPRLVAADADLDRVFHLATGDEPDAISIPDDLPELEALIEERGDIALVVFDPLVAFLSDKTDTHRDHDTRKALEPLARMAQRTGVCVVGVMHLNKKDGADPYQRLSASVAFYNAVRSVLFWGVPPTDNEESGVRVLVSQKMNLGPRPEPLWFRIEGVVAAADGVVVETLKVVPIPSQGNVSASQLIGGEQRRRGSKVDQAAGIIEGLIGQDGYVESANLDTALRGAGISSSTGRDATTRLGLERTKVGYSPARWYTHKPDAVLPEPQENMKSAPSSSIGPQNPRSAGDDPKARTVYAFGVTGERLSSFEEDTDRTPAPSSEPKPKVQTDPPPGVPMANPRNASGEQRLPTCPGCGKVPLAILLSGLCRPCQNATISIPQK
jgi:hypothetical protein